MEGEFRVGPRRHVAGVAIAVVVDARGLSGPVGDDATGVPVVVVARVGVRSEQPEGVVVAVDDAPQAAAVAEVGEDGETSGVLSSGILGFGYVRGYDSGFGPLQYTSS